jgi:hypothetical protein
LRPTQHDSRFDHYYYSNHWTTAKFVVWSALKLWVYICNKWTSRRKIYEILKSTLLFYLYARKFNQISKVQKTRTSHWSVFLYRTELHNPNFQLLFSSFPFLWFVLIEKHSIRNPLQISLQPIDLMGGWTFPYNYMTFLYIL